MAFEDRPEVLNGLMASLLRDGDGPPNSTLGLARILAQHDNPLLRVAQSGPPIEASSHDEARRGRERNIQLDRENTASGYFGHFTPTEMQEYLATGREPRDIMQRVEAAAAEREAARRPRSLPPPSSDLVPLTLPPAPQGEAGPPRNRLAEIPPSKPLEEVHFTDYLQPGAGHPRTPQEQAVVIEQLKAARASSDPRQQQWAQDFVDRFGSLPLGVAANTATHGWSDWLMSRMSNPPLRGHLVGIDPPNEYPRQAFPFPIYEEGELPFARTLAHELNPYQNALARGVGYAAPVGAFSRLAKLLRFAPSSEEVPSNPAPGAGGGPGPRSSGASPSRTEAIPGTGYRGESTGSGPGRYARPPLRPQAQEPGRPGQSDASPSPSSSEPPVEFRPFDPNDIVAQRPLNKPRVSSPPRASPRLMENPLARAGGRPPDRTGGGQGGAPAAHQYDVLDDNELLRLLLERPREHD